MRLYLLVFGHSEMQGMMAGMADNVGAFEHTLQRGAPVTLPSMVCNR